MRNDSDFFKGLGIIAAFIGVIALIIFAPMISFFISYFVGWLCKITFGDILCNSLNTLFNTKTFVPENLPIIAGALGWIGWIVGSFKPINLSKDKDE